MDFETPEELLELIDGPFSMFENINENLEYDMDACEEHRKRVKYYRDLKHRIEKMVNKGDVRLNILDDQFSKQDRTQELLIWALLPKLPKDYIEGIRIWWHDKTMNNFNWIFSNYMLFPILNVIALKEGQKKELFDIFLMHSKEEYFEKVDVVIYMRKWLLKYYPNHNLDVRYLEGE